MVSELADKVLNLRMDSKPSGATCKFCDAKKEFHNSFTFDCFRRGFRSAAHCYVDK